MSEENVEIATRWYEPATGKNALLAAMPRTMALAIPSRVERTRRRNDLRGREGVRRRLEESLQSFDDYRYDVQRIIDCGDDEVLVEAAEVGRGALSGARFARPTTSCSRSGTDDGAYTRVLRRR